VISLSAEQTPAEQAAVLLKPTVAIVAPGNMGAGLARALGEHGIKVLTSLTGRSAASEVRAHAAGMQPVSPAELTAADFLLSVLPPASALAFARQMAPVLQAATRKPLFVDCNAVSPKTVREIGAVIEATGSPCVDAGIIGLPPQPGRKGPRLYASGAEAARLAQLAGYGMDVRVLEGPIGAASALKMSFAGINKGLTAVASAMILGATRAGAAQALRQELAESWPALMSILSQQVPDMLPKAYRYVGEMREIAGFAGEDAATQAIYDSIAQLYERIAQDFEGEKRESSALTGFFGR
jgi:3-hydroxyisobutyrate dehydrogenase-like beta-hydroxyacid dehydrogenase